MNILKCISLTIAILATTAVSALSEEVFPDDATKMEGVWVAEKVTFSGREVPPKKFPFELHFGDAKLTFKFVGDTTGKDRIHEIVIDPTKGPSTIDIMREIGGKKETVLGIYKFEEGKLMICSLRGADRKPSAKRPTNFASDESVSSDLLVLKRKPDAEPERAPDATRKTE